MEGDSDAVAVPVDVAVALLLAEELAAAGADTVGLAPMRGERVVRTEAATVALVSDAVEPGEYDSEGVSFDVPEEHDELLAVADADAVTLGEELQLSESRDDPELSSRAVGRGDAE